MIRRTARGGSIVGFVAACLVGAVLLVGSVYAVRHAGWFQNGAGTTTSISSKAGTSSNGNGGTSKDTSNSQSSNGSNKSSSSTNSSPTTGNSSDTAGTTSQNDSSQSTQSATKLPTTGPADVLASLFAVGSLTAALTAYMRSRRTA